MRWLLLVMPLIMPMLIGRVYEPINRNWTVELFGCGCPPIDGSWRFNANDFNALLWLEVFSICAGAYCGIAWRRFAAWRGPLIMVGVALLLLSCLGMYTRGVWL